MPGVSSAGRPNDYINMFLEEMKSWLRNQLTLDNVCAEELERRHVYITKLKHDNYYWYGAVLLFSSSDRCTLHAGVFHKK